jgi:hypothetical protein
MPSTKVSVRTSAMARPPATTSHSAQADISGG